jgi:hypothetical protein
MSVTKDQLNEILVQLNKNHEELMRILASVQDRLKINTGRKAAIIDLLKTVEESNHVQPESKSTAKQIKSQKEQGPESIL